MNNDIKDGLLEKIKKLKVGDSPMYVEPKV
jgi:hypothetical protein